MRWSLLMSVCGLGLTLGQGVAWAQAKEAAPTQAQPVAPTKTAERRVGLWVLDEHDATKTLAQSVKSTLEENKYQVIEVGELRRTIERQRISSPKPQEQAELAQLKTDLDAGEKAYFYDSPQVAIEKLEPLIERASRKLDALSHEPEVAEALYKGYATLIRAYIDQDDIPRAKRAAKGLVRLFPHAEPSSGSIPQNVISIIDVTKEAIQQRASYVTLRMINGGDGCQLYVNGLKAVERSRFVVDPEGSYQVKMSCDPSRPSYVWPVKVSAGKTEEFLVVDRDPFDFAMADDSFDSRALAEGYMGFVVQWTELPQVVGLSRAQGKSGDESFLLVRLDESKKAVWSDGTSNRTVLKLLTSVFPEIKLKELPANERSSSSSTWAWATTVVGALAIVGGGVYGYINHMESERYRCTPNQSGGVDSGCEGVDAFTPPGSNDEVSRFNEDWNDVSSKRWWGLGVMGAGVILTTVGVVGVVLSDGEGESESGRLELLPTLGGAQVRWRF